VFFSYINQSTVFAAAYFRSKRTRNKLMGGNSTVTSSNVLRHAGHSCQLIDVTQCVLSFSFLKSRNATLLSRSINLFSPVKPRYDPHSHAMKIYENRY
jgi:hypothetical protein